MFNFDYKSARGAILPLMKSQNFKLVNIDAQTSVGTSISSVIVGGVDGDTVNNVQAIPRTIILDLLIENDIENTKRQILDIIKPKQTGTLIWTQDERELEISGIVESIDMPRWMQGVIMQITMHCAQPFWENIDFIIERINQVKDAHYFTDYENDMLFFPEEGIVLGEYDEMRTKGVYNAGDVDVGLLIEILALGTVTNPIIYDLDGNFFGCGYGQGNKKVVMNAGDIIRINTRKNEKEVTLNGASIISKIKPNSTWLQLKTGDNQFAINSDDESVDNMTFYFTYKQRYI